MGLIYALDIGIASVGWAVVDEDTYQIVRAGSNLFESADAAGNVDRRGFRQLRRLHRRRAVRVEDFNKLWTLEVGSIPDEINNETLSLRVKGLKDALNVNDVYCVLHNMLLHRGVSYLDDAFDENESAKGDYARGIEYNRQALKEHYPCEIQMDRLEKLGAYRGHQTAVEDGEQITYSNVFPTSAYLSEIEQFLEVQKKANALLSDSFCEEYKRIFLRKRKYYDGPGNELSRTDYGRYTTKIDPETGEYVTDKNIFEKLIGKCSIYSGETRAAGASYTAQEFNALNDLNNLTVNDRKLEEDEKRAIIQTYCDEKAVSMKGTKVRKIIEKVIGEPIINLSGARIDKSENELYHTMEVYRMMKKALAEIDISIEEFSREDLDQIGHVLTINTDKEGIEEGFENAAVVLSDAAKDVFIGLRKKNGSSFSKWQSFSLKIMNELIPVMYEEPKEQMTILSEMGYIKTNRELYKGLKAIPTKGLLEEIYNPVVRRSVNISIRVLNELIKTYGNPVQVVIEMPRDRNSDEQRKRISDFQKKREKEISDIENRIFQEYGRKITKNDYRNHNNLTLKLKLWNEQEGRCLYSGKTIDIDNLIDDPYAYEVDHIIPRSISLDDSRNNKVLVCPSENQNKGNRTPYDYLRHLPTGHRTFDEFKADVLNLKKKKNILQRKVDNLLFTQDITKLDVVRGFTNRNMTDTAYASRTVLNVIQNFFAANETGTKVKVVRGGFTHQMRVALKLPKDREESFAHHAIDASLIAFSVLGYDAYKKIRDDVIDYETGEILDEEKAKDVLSDERYTEILYGKKWRDISDEIKRAEKEVSYWHRVDTKPNRELSKATIHGTREKDGKIFMISKVALRDKNTKKKIEDGKIKFLMEKKDPKTFEFLKKIVEDYKDSENPFVDYEKETGDIICKYSKKGNGPKIDTLKYYDGEVGSSIDISHKYGHEKGSKKVILESLAPFRMDVYYNKETKRYTFIGVKYAMCRFDKRKYVIDTYSYEEELRREKLLSKCEHLEDLKGKGIEFCLTFYKNEIIRYEKEGTIYEERFLSRSLPAKVNYIETKPIDRQKFEKRHLIGLPKTTLVKKVRTDILGKKYTCDKEAFSFTID